MVHEGNSWDPGGGCNRLQTRRPKKMTIELDLEGRKALKIVHSRPWCLSLCEGEL